MTDAQWEKIEPYFYRKELYSRDAMREEMQYGFMRLLLVTRLEAQMPFIMTSGWRTPQRNEDIGGNWRSAHLTGWAGDVKAVFSWQKFTIINAALTAGFNRIGIGNTFIHLDNKPGYVENVIWTYSAKTKLYTSGARP